MPCYSFQKHSCRTKPLKFRIHLNSAEINFVLVALICFLVSPLLFNPLGLNFSLTILVYSLLRSGYSAEDAWLLTLKFLYLTSRIILPSSSPTTHIPLTLQLTLYHATLYLILLKYSVSSNTQTYNHMNVMFAIVT